MKKIIVFTGLVSMLSAIAWSAEKVVVIPLNSRSSTPSQSWDTVLPDEKRFTLVMGGAAVLDNETGLVWEKSPATGKLGWNVSRGGCFKREIANRFGWRLPTIEELATLVDRRNSNPALPANHPFENIQLDYPYWTTTTVAWATSYAYNVRFSNGNLNEDPKTSVFYYWCVRGGQGPDSY